MLQLAGVELYFDDVEKAKRFYREVVGLTVLDEQSRHYARFAGGPALCVSNVKGRNPIRRRTKPYCFFT